MTGKAPKADPAERETERTALGIDGEYVKHVTHRIQPHDPNARLVAERIVREPEGYCEVRGECVAKWLHWTDPETLQRAPDTLSAADARLRTFDFSGDVRLGNVELKPYAGAITRQPLIVATASKAIIDDHSGIFTEPFLQFLVPYIALIESKIAMNPGDDREKKRRARRRYGAGPANTKPAPAPRRLVVRSNPSTVESEQRLQALSIEQVQ